MIVCVARDMTATPFDISVSDSVLEDLRNRLAHTRWPGAIDGAGWDYGTDPDFLRELVEYWRADFDWRAQEAALNALPQFHAEVDGQRLHFVHQRGKGPSPTPLLLSHGFPSSFWEMSKVIGPLSDPAAYGGDPADAFDVVVMSLPGYGFSDAPRQSGANVAWLAQRAHALMTEVLGYESYGVQGGDWGGYVASRLGFAHPDAVTGIHLNLVGASPHPSRRTDLSEAERAWLKEMARWQQTESGYLEIQATKPQTLSYGLNDSPTGLCAWIVEKFRSWSDCDGDVESVYSKDELLTNVTIYWVTQTIDSAGRLYYEDRRHPWRMGPDDRIDVPTAFARFPREIIRPPREWADRVYNVARWTDLPRGGHFPAFEQPELLVEDVRAFFRELR